jgi:hypothetical protein
MQPSGVAGVLARALAILVGPGRAWDTIESEAVQPRRLFARYVGPLAAIPAVCGVAGPLIFGFNIANVGVKISVVGLVLGAAVGYGLTLAAVYLLAQFVVFTAPAFGGARDRDQALKLVAYAATASWVGGFAELYPSLGFPVGILAGLYSLYALFLGLPQLMRIADGRRYTAFAAILLALLALWVVRDMIKAKATELGGPLSAYSAPR